MKNRKLNRLKGFNYANGGLYFVTICTVTKKNIFGVIENGQMQISDVGEIVDKCWRKIPEHFQNIQLDEFTIMPDHMHGIINIVNKRNEDIRSLQSDNKRWYGAGSGSLSSVIRSFKIGVTKWCRNNGYENFKWQKSFHDRIIRDKYELRRIRKYIIENPEKWQNRLDEVAET
ncbi:MAG: transposase [Candidatus Margulisiibacteriota bacterium]